VRRLTQLVKMGGGAGRVRWSKGLNMRGYELAATLLSDIVPQRVRAGDANPVSHAAGVRSMVRSGRIALWMSTNRRSGRQTRRSCTSISSVRTSATAGEWFDGAPGFATTAIVIVALGIGATTAAFSVTDFVLFQGRSRSRNRTGS